MTSDDRASSSTDEGARSLISPESDGPAGPDDPVDPGDPVPTDASTAAGDSPADPTDPEGPDGPDTSPGARRRVPWWARLLVLVLTLLLVGSVFKAVVGEVYYIPSRSMEPGLEVGDRILVEKFSYAGDGTPERGDVVVFADPGGWLPDEEEPGAVARVLSALGLRPSGGHLVKRVIGVAGDTIECCDDQGRISVNGQPLDEADFLSRDAYRECDGAMIGCDWSAGPVPEGRLFVMGDNRSDTADSTVHLCRHDATDCADGNAYVPTDLVVGRVWAVVWPLSQWTRVERPAVFDTIGSPQAP